MCPAILCKIYYQQCLNCKKIFILKSTDHPHQQGKVFCSKKCRHEYGFPEKRSPLKKCGVCGKMFKGTQRGKKKPQRFCSKSCGTKHRNLVHGNNVDKQTVRDKISKKMKENWAVHFSPETKARIFEGAAKGRENNGNFLAHWISKPENQKRMSNYWKQRLKEHPDQHINLRLKRNCMTKLERDTEVVLKMLGIKSKWNQVCHLKDCFCFPDFTVLDTNIVVECNGDHWHNPIETEQRRQRYLDNGYYAVMLSESCIKAGTNSIVQVLLDSPLKEIININKL